VRKFWYSPTLRSVAVYGMAGLGFAGANLVLARVLPTPEYGLFTLFTALAYLGYALAPAGVDGIVNRRRLDPGPYLFRRAATASLLVGAVFVVFAQVAYELTPPLLLLLFVSIVAGGLMAVAGAQYSWSPPVPCWSRITAVPGFRSSSRRWDS
jgi:O-antigen/teichoic acid export membrane protein